MAFPGPGYKSPRKKEDLKTKKGIISTTQYLTKKQEKLYKDIGEAIVRYCKDNVGTVYIEDIKMLNSSKVGVHGQVKGWTKMEFYFKVVE